MAACAPQRFLANNRNQARTAVLTASSVLPVSNSVLALPTTRSGTAQAALSGAYSGPEEALYEVEVVDSSIEVPLVSAPVFSGEGSGSISDISAAAIAQSFTVELSQSGLPLLYAAIDFEGVTLRARTPGAAGNAITIEVDQAGLTFTPQPYSLLRPLAAGAGGDTSGLRGSEYNFDTTAIGADGQIPASAHRIAFGKDTSAIYLQYKAYQNGEWLYYFVPALKRDVPAGAVVSFVTGGRTVTIASPAETYAGIETLYDLLNQIKTNSALVDVDGVIANDRAPTGQAAHELVTRTDAHYEPSTGSGSESAQGFEDVSVAPEAGTQLVIATCRAVSPTDHPLAGIGRERWELKSSLLGALGTIVTDEPFSGAQFSLRIPTRLPYSFGDGLQKGNFTVTNIQYASRAEGDPDPPPICPAVGARAGLLGPAAVDQTLTLTYTKRPSGDCDCTGMPTPNLDTACLGNQISEGSTSMGYQADTIERLKGLREWFAETVRSNSSTETVGGSGFGIGDPYLFAPEPDPSFPSFPLISLQALVDKFESTLAQIDPLAGGSPSLRADGCNEWDDAFDELQTDVATFDALDPGAFTLASIPTARYEARLAQVLITAGISPLGESSASTVVSGDGCWRDYGDPFYWTIVGSVGGAYAPAFTNHPCWLSRRAEADGAYYSTHEAAFQINVQPSCIAALREGDTLTYSINGAAAWPSTYQIGDELSLAIVGAAPLSLAGGQDASLVQNWYATGSVTGALPPFSYDPEAPVPYSAGPPSFLEFTLTPGGVPFVNGDRFAFSVEGGHYRWRVDGGAWHASAPIPQSNAALSAGLYVQFTPGAAPSFGAGDLFAFRALQPWAVSNVRAPTPEPWRWSESSPYMILDLGSEQELDMGVFGRHTLPEGTGILWQGGVAPGVYLWSDAGAWQPGAIVTPFAAPRLARYVKFSLTGAAGGGIGWLWVGLALTTKLAANVALRPSYKVARPSSGGLYQRGRSLGRAMSADIEWPEASLDEADARALVEMLDWIKMADDEPFIFLPQIERPEEALLAHVMVDEVELPDIFSYQPKAGKERRLSAKLPTQGVWR